MHRSWLFVAALLVVSCKGSKRGEPPEPPEDAAIDLPPTMDAATGRADASFPSVRDAAAGEDGGATGAGPDARAPSPDAGGLDASAQPRDAEADGQTPGADCKLFVMPDDCAAPAGGGLPLELRCTGLYADFAARELACGVMPYKPAFELWSDGAEKQRYAWLPPGETIDATDPDSFVYPVGTQFWKEFRVPVGEGEMRAAETRLLRKTEAGWLYTTYVWSLDQQTALQENQGVANWQGTGHLIPTRDQCAQCHEGRADLVLGWDMWMLGPGAQGVTREALVAQGRLISLAPGSGEPSMPSQIPGDALERAALGYLHANCGVSCHNPSSFARARDSGLHLQLQVAPGLTVQDTAAVRTGVNKLPNPHAVLPSGGPYLAIRPGDPDHSLVVARMDTRGPAAMPRLGTTRVDEEGVELIAEWIAAMTPQRGYAAPAELPTMPEADAGPGLDASAPDAGPQEADAAPSDAGSPEAGVPTACDATQAPEIGSLSLSTVVRDASLATLTFAAQAPGSADWYLVEMRGRILVVRDGVLDPEPFLDLSAAINLRPGFDQTTLTYDERGLVGLAFAPDYPESGLFYVAITPSRENQLGLPVNHDMVIEFERSPGAPPVRRRTLVDVGSADHYLGTIHNANTVLFGPDGMLYVGMGDGGGVRCGDAEPNMSQSIGSLFGKILRLDLSRPAPYGALDNPFVGEAGGDPRVLHYGLRNPFRFAFDKLTGDLYLGDVGQNRYEEVNFAPAGARGLNFGWARFEAHELCSAISPRPLRPGSTHTPPVFVADRSGTGPFSDYRAIVGGRVYRGTALPELQGTYLFGDYYGRRLGAFVQCGTQRSPVAVIRKNCDPNFDEPCLRAPAGAPAFVELTAIVEGHDDELYLVANGDSLLKIVRGP